MPSRLSLVAAGFLLSGGFVTVLIALSFPELPHSACTMAGYGGDDPPSGFKFYEFYLGRNGLYFVGMGYSRDGGVNRCDTPIVTIPIGLLAIGGAILGIDRWNR